ncbi:unnamed protein product [Symbiodinium necroappetens]|uniref:Uncharacterized protein n=1 Tax=Symbiodinium necroappetens TaxID=1628268 RepID=A0A813AAG2_9DINO|nr:unnamed protein product [Symbiodinium necroappetens]
MTFPTSMLKQQRRLSCRLRSCATALLSMVMAFAIVTCGFVPSAGWVGGSNPAEAPESIPRTQARVQVGEPAFRPAYGFERASPLGPRPQDGEAVAGLRTWLKQMGLEDHLPAANAWCEEMGASVMAEILEDLEDFVEGMNLNDEDSQTLRKRGKVALSNLLQRGEIIEQQAVVDGEEEFKTSGRTFLKKPMKNAS